MKKVKLDFSSNFERYEKKFLIEPSDWKVWMKSVEEHMELDQYGLHTICSLYYDTPDFAYVRHSLDKPMFKEKLRVRSYGVPTKDYQVFLELKKKVDQITYKRRVGLPLEECEEYLYTLKLPENEDINWQEIDWFCHRSPLEKKMIISYDRLAYFGKQNINFRITFDQNIRWRASDLDLIHGDYGTNLLPPKVVLMEVKTLDALPMWLCRSLSDLKIYPIGYSKYGYAYGEFMNQGEKGGIRFVG